MSTRINPYLIFNGQCEEAMNFYKSVFGGEFSDFNRYGDMPSSEENQIPDHQKNRIMHITFPISAETVLMASDAHPLYPPVDFGHNISLSVGVDSKDRATQIFNGLAEGGKITMPISDTFWGAYFGMLIDRFGISWMINYDYPK